MGEESRQSRGLVCSYCGAKGAGLANEFIDLPGKAEEGTLLQGAIAEKPRIFTNSDMGAKYVTCSKTIKSSCASGSEDVSEEGFRDPNPCLVEAGGMELEGDR
tara:strand:+ start:5207 stop:5515 length:309 start_codon:yes stop_codon:yes gene_type:complete